MVSAGCREKQLGRWFGVMLEVRLPAFAMLLRMMTSSLRVPSSWAQPSLQGTQMSAPRGRSRVVSCPAQSRWRHRIASEEPIGVSSTTLGAGVGANRTRGAWEFECRLPGCHVKSLCSICMVQSVRSCHLTLPVTVPWNDDGHARGVM